MAASITVAELKHRLASRNPPRVLDVRRRQFHAASPHGIAGATWRDPSQVAQWSAGMPIADEIVVYCVHGLHVGRNTADALAASGFHARYLEGGVTAWAAAGGPLDSKPVRGVTWITRARPKIDRIACPWLIERFIDPQPTFVYAPADSVLAEAERLEAVPYDIPGVDLGHDGDLCSFDAFLRIYALSDPALAHLAAIVRGADTGRLDPAPQSAGLLALSLGLSRNFADDHEMLRHGMVMYDALYSWCRAQAGEAHGWNPTP